MFALIPERQCAAINSEVLTGDIRSAGANQEACHLAQITGVTIGVERHASKNFFLALLIHDLLKHFAAEPAGGNGVDTNVVASPFDGKAARHSQHSALTGAVGDDLGKAQMRAHARNVDDAPAPGGLLEMRISQNAQLKDILHIDIHNLIKPIHRKVFGAAFVRNAGIVDQKIQYTVVWRGDFLQ